MKHGFGVEKCAVTLLFCVALAKRVTAIRACIGAELIEDVPDRKSHDLN